MQTKIYVSFDQINKDLEILKLEKELNYQKLTISLEKTKNNIQLQYFKNELINYVKERISGSLSGILVLIIPYFLKFLKRKRG